VAFLPFGKMIDEWRWQVFSGQVTPENYNAAWWALREKYQGIRPPVERTEADFDPGAKYHIPGNTPYTRYFLSFILQFQFQKALCDTAGFKGPLSECSIYGNEAAGRKVRRDAVQRPEPTLAGHAFRADRDARNGRRRRSSITSSRCRAGSSSRTRARPAAGNACPTPPPPDTGEARAGSLKRAPAGEQVVDHDDDGDDQQHVNEAAERV
jgi:hypothetical protein